MADFERADFGAGCFWGVEATFRQVPGVVDVACGYEGGHLEKPTYGEVCTGRTGHAEVVQVLYDPAQVSYQRLLEVFFENHDPTTLNSQGPDHGTQYRSVVFYHNAEQKGLAEAEKQRREASGQYASAVVTAIEPAARFYRAEEYHQRYFELRGISHLCHLGNGKKPGHVAPPITAKQI